MNRSIRLKRGLDLRLTGEVPQGAVAENRVTDLVAVVPDDYPGFVPRVAVKAGQTVAEGEPLMTDKNNELVTLVSPVAGVVEEVVRGERRKVMRITVKPEGSALAAATACPTTPEEIRKALMQSGLWALMRQRPYAIVPNPDREPVNIFVTAFDSAPLATSLEARVAGREAEIEAGIKALKKLTSGDVYVSVRPKSTLRLPSEAVRVNVSGPHPAGNPGVQGANIAPVNKGETIWTLDIVTVARIGAMMLNGRPYWTTTVALTGSEVQHPCLIDTVIGARLSTLLSGNLKKADHHVRVIAGNVLSGAAESNDGFLRFPYTQVTVIPEGDDVNEFMGWASLSPRKMSESRTFPSKLMGRGAFAPDARLQGARRAMIMSEIYDKMLPMDIMPEYLIKAILSRDIDKMEQLGIYEVAPEDFALCEYADPSKLELQKIVREGLDYLRKELE